MAITTLANRGWSVSKFLIFVSDSVSASPWWSILFALGFIVCSSSALIFFRWHEEHSEEQENFYLVLALVGLVVFFISAIMIWRGLPTTGI